MTSNRTFCLTLFFALGIINLFSQSAPPNILLIMTDDQGYGDLAYHGNPQIHTPALDKLAAESVRFTNFYVSPVCAPTRSSLMTGRYNIRTGIFDTYCGGAIMAPEENTMAEIFRDAGYATGHFGKWHLGDNYPSRPHDQGFMTSVWHQSGGLAQVGDVPNYHRRDSAYFDPILWKNSEKYPTKGYCSDVFTDEAIQFMQAHRDGPFLAYLAFNAPHTPLQVPQEYYDRYKDMEIDPEVFRNKGEYVHDISANHQEAARGVYAMVTNIDDNIQRLMDALEELDLAENTIVIFLTDNGPQQYRYVGGFRGTKGTVREGGIHVPFYMRLPEGMAQVNTVEQTAAHIDVLPTLASLCKLDLPENTPLDGRNLSAFLQSAETPALERSLFFEWQRSYPELYRNMAVIRDGYKLMGFVGGDADISEFELYNLEEDPYEARNIVEEKPVIARWLKAELDRWHADIMASPHINDLPRIVVGSPHENPSLLNRNDARGLQIIWAQPDVYVSWDVTVARAGAYRAKVHFTETLPERGRFILRIGNRTFTKEHSGGEVNELVYESLPLVTGDFKIDGWFTAPGGKLLTPFYLELERLEHE
ncbi:arylsulfatase [Flavilitoribacter nigricans]|uniref:Arylsulfatase n=1 Tax=Flavilitoribacter nigricans (strain ATCC 23147 / DSM 23189 / NBRC 102662 / NCIMB 1420 / SS-2) TaxID=1122177 RepID=A0A2D0N2L1_FLAN2|nr:arylsulfatase [Flavilitoribacter nigricans]PHN02687.1 arylsulfatase [Flavilitoribacter nigricans DSM 23189 = NBRC 102662]